jgi:CrcB protein
MNSILLVFIGGGFGSLARYGMAELVRRNFEGNFPLATFFSNLLSCTVLALATYFITEKSAGSLSVKLLVITGFCGGFSTFSAFSFETISLIRAGYAALAVWNVALSLGVCFVLVYILAKAS